MALDGPTVMQGAPAPQGDCSGASVEWPTPNVHSGRGARQGYLDVKAKRKELMHPDDTNLDATLTQTDREVQSHRPDLTIAPNLSRLLTRLQPSASLQRLSGPRVGTLVRSAVATMTVAPPATAFSLPGIVTLG